MKILYHHRNASSEGQHVHIEELVTALRDRGHDVIVVGPRRTNDTGIGGRNRIFASLRNHLPRAAYEILEFGYTAFAFLHLRRAYLKHRPDVLYERYNLFLLAGCWIKSKYGIPLILEVNSPLLQERLEHNEGIALRRFAAWTQRKAWRTADVVLPVTDKLADFLRNAAVPEKRIRVIQNGVNQRRFRPDIDGNHIRRALGLEGKLVLGFTGFIRAWHGLSHVIDVIAGDTDNPDIHFFVIGDGPARSELEAYARERGVADRLTVLGVIQRDQLAEHMAVFDIALQPQAVEYASPLKLFEYMAMGHGIVAPDQDNIREVLTHGEDALLFDPGDPGAFHAAILALCHDANLRQRLGTAARAKIERDGFTWENNALRLEQLVENLLSY